MIENAILLYYQAINDGSVVVGKWIRDWYAYIVRGLEEKRFKLDLKKASRAVRFIERYCHHHEGPLAPGRIKLELWQRAMISVIFGIVDGDGHRQFREAYIVIARKNGKTLLASAIAAYMLYMDGEYGARVYFCAPRLEQARLCYDALYQMITKEPDMASGTKRRRSDLYYADSNSSAAPLAFSFRKSDGLNPTLVVCDENSSWPGEQGLKQYEVFKSAQGARKQPLILSISTAGYVNDGIYDELMRRSTAVINGSSKETRLAPFIYMIDDPDKWNDISELQKSNPNLGVSTSVDYLLEEINVAEGSISKRMEFKTKYANLKQNSSAAWVEMETLNRCRGEHLDPEQFRGCYCVGGIDLSLTTDLTAACIIVYKNGRYNVLTHFWLPSASIDDSAIEDALPYRAYIDRGFLSASGDHDIDHMDVYRWFVDMVERYELYPLWVGYDRYCASPLVQAMTAYGFHMDSVFQGENLTGIIGKADGMMKDGAINIGDNDLMAVHMLDACLKLNAENDRRKCIKIRKSAHVDGMHAMLDAICMLQVHADEIGQQLLNDG